MQSRKIWRRFADVKDQMALAWLTHAVKKKYRSGKQRSKKDFRDMRLWKDHCQLMVTYWSGGTGDYLHEEIVTGNCDEMRSILEVDSEQLHNLYCERWVLFTR